MKYDACWRQECVAVADYSSEYFDRKDYVAFAIASAVATIVEAAFVAESDDAAAADAVVAVAVVVEEVTEDVMPIANEAVDHRTMNIAYAR